MSTVRIACLGDIMCGDSFYNAGRGVAASLRKYGKHFLRPEIVDFLAGHDVVVGNVECVLSDKGRNARRLRSVHMRGAGRSADLLAGWNLTVANVANNHILEHGYEAAADTVDNLLRSGVRVVGAGAAHRFRDGVHVERLCRRGLALSFVGMCLRREKYAFSGGGGLDEVIKTVTARRAAGDFVVVCVHWGDEFMDYPSLEQGRVADSLIEAGAGLILGHHPHVLQGIQTRNGSLVAYSLGNFMFDSFIPDCRWSVMLSADIAEGRLSRWRCLPILHDLDYRPVLARDPGKRTLIAEFERRCGLLDDRSDEDARRCRYRADFRLRDARARRGLLRHLLRHISDIDKVFWPQILLRPFQRRLGLW